MMPKIGVYILQGSRYYVGSTDDLDRRLIQHARGHTHSTKRINDWMLKKFIPCSTLEAARLLERRIKKSKNIARWIEQPRSALTRCGVGRRFDSCRGYQLCLVLVS